MAHVVLSPTGSRREWFVVSAAVGPGLANVADDVYLVQFLLRVAAETVGSYAGYVPPGEKPMAIDGRFGPQTRNYIAFYQQEVNRRVGEKRLEPDGRIDPIKPGQQITGITRTFYTILDLNVAFRTRRGDNARIETHPLWPRQLNPSFFI